MAHPDAYRLASPIWLEQLIGNSFGRKSLARLLIFAAVPWIISLIVAAIAGEGARYISTPAFYISVAGVALTEFGILYGSMRQYAAYDRLLSCFELDRDKRRTHILGALDRHSDFWDHTRAAVIIWAISSTLLCAGLFFWQDLSSLAAAIGTVLPRFEALNQYGWYDPDRRIVTALIVEIHLIFISLLLGTSASILIRMPTFLWRASRESPKFPPGLVRIHYAAVASFYSTISLLWIAGVGLILYFFGLNRDWLSYGVVILAFAAGVVNFGMPQIAYLRSLELAEEFYLNDISNRLESLNLLPGRGESKIADSNKAADASSTESLFSLIQLLSYRDWVYPIHQTYFVLGTYLFSLAASLMGWERFIFFLKG